MRKLSLITFFTIFITGCSKNVMNTILTADHPTGEFYCAKFIEKNLVDNSHNEYMLKITKQNIIIYNKYKIAMDGDKIVKKIVKGDLGANITGNLDGDTFATYEKLNDALSKYDSGTNFISVEHNTLEKNYFCLKNKKILNSLIENKNLINW